jgi:hypothetical protein
VVHRLSKSDLSTPVEAGRILSYPEMHARIDMLLSAGLLDVTEAFMEAELNLKTMGRVASRELNRIRWKLRLQLARGDWTGISPSGPRERHKRFNIISIGRLKGLDVGAPNVRSCLKVGASPRESLTGVLYDQ